MRKWLNKNWPGVILVLISLILTISHTRYVQLTQQFPEMDEHLYMDIAVEFYRLLQKPSWETIGKMNQFLVDHPPFRPPVYPLSITLPLLIFGIGNSYKIALWINILYYIGSIVGVYLVGRQFLSRLASACASVLFAFYGWTLFYLHFTYSETATTTFVVWSLFFLLKSKELTRRKYALLFGLTFCLGTLIRWVVPLFLMGPILLILVRIIRLPASIRKKIYINTILICFLMVPTIFFHWMNREQLGTYFTSQFFSGSLTQLVPAIRRSHISLQATAYYFKIFEQLTIYIFILFLAGLTCTLLKWRTYGQFLIAFFVSYVFFTFGTVIKDDRYIVPIYPYIALISAAVVDLIRNYRMKIILISTIIIFSVGNFLGASWGVGPLGQEGLASILLPMPVGHPRRIHFTTMVWPPTKNFSNARQIVDAIISPSRRITDNQIQVVRLFNYHALDNAIYSIDRYQTEFPFYIHHFPASDFLKTPGSVSNRLILILESADYILLKQGGVVADEYHAPEGDIVLSAILEELESRNSLYISDGNLFTTFSLVKQVTVPLDSSTVLIYQKTKSPAVPLITQFAQAVESRLPKVY